MTRRPKDTSLFPVMKAKCSTCPFRTDAKGRHLDVMVVERIQKQCLTKASQICHHPTLQGKPETHLCRGARDFQLEVFYRLGVLEAPTDAAWRKQAQDAKLSSLTLLGD